MLIKDILKRAGWNEVRENKKYYSYSPGELCYTHPTKKIKYRVQKKELVSNGKTIAKFSVSKKQDEVTYDEFNQLLIIDGVIALHVGV